MAASPRDAHLFGSGPKRILALEGGAVAASILTAAYHMLRDGTLYQDLGDNHFNRACPEQKAGRLVRQIAKLGFEWTITPSARGLVSV
jgi:hypothetical protein